MGYHLAGFEVVGVDIARQRNYPFVHIQEDAFAVLEHEWFVRTFDVIHASPPCQAYSILRNRGKQSHIERHDLVELTRERLLSLGRPFVIENVPQAPLLNPVRLCGSYFGLAARRHRDFESNVNLYGTPCFHEGIQTVGVYGDHAQITKGMNRAATLREAQEAMGIDWMTWQEMAEAIPPVYTRFLGAQILRSL